MGFLQDVPRALRDDLRGLVKTTALSDETDFRVDLSVGHKPNKSRWDVGLPLVALSFVLYLWIGWVIDQGTLNHLYNVAFDLDGPRFVLLFAGDSADWDEGTTATDYLVKHPFLLALRGPGLALRGLGLSAEMSVALMLALAGAGTVACAWYYLRLLSVGLLESALLTVFFAGSCAQLFYSTLIESYGFAALTLAYVHVAALMRSRQRWVHPRGRFLTALVTFGVTSTNVAMAGLAEIFVWVRRVGSARAVTRIVSYSILLAALLAVSVAAVYPSSIPAILNPVDGAKQVKWVGVLADTEIPKGGLDRELVTFAGYGFVAPELEEVLIEGGEKSMVDFRAPVFSPLGGIALGGWLVLLLCGALCHAQGREGRHRLALYVGCLVFNLVLHAIFQHRGSIFIVASHAHFPLFACAAGAAIVSSRAARGTRILVQVALGVLTLLTLIVNLGSLFGLIERFAT